MTQLGPVTQFGNESDELVQENPWADLRRFTQARLALGRVGASLPTDAVLRFSLAHAMARDAVHLPLDIQALAEALTGEGFRVRHAHSEAPDRAAYLLRPDLGRRLADDSRSALEQEKTAPAELVVVIADGLSAIAVERHALSLLKQLRAQIDTDWARTPIVLTTQGRVAIGDDIGETLGARLVIVLIGERPGLTAPDSLGAYLTYQPKRGRMNSERNCVSNIHAAGTSYALGAHKIGYLAREALRLKLTGVRLKDDSDTPLITA